MAEGHEHGAHHDADSAEVNVEARPTRFTGPGRHELGFRIVDASGEPILSFDEAHERRMHLIIVRKDLSFFAHVHPAMEDDGWWHTEVELSDPGPHRAFADFATGGRSLTLPFDLDIAGDHEPRSLEPPLETVDVDGFVVRMDRSSANGLTFTVTRSGAPVALAPYLGALGHLVVIRAEDLAFLHVHPISVDKRGVVRFMLHLPGAGEYKAYLQFIADGAVRTAAFVLASETLST
jgi:hypothetical protein